MSRIEHIKQRLENWARWSVEASGGSLGYPRQNVLARLAGHGRRGEATIPVDNIEAAETDDAVEAMQHSHPHLHATVVGHYIGGQGVRGLALSLCKAESTIRRHFEDADQVIAVWLRVRRDRNKIDTH